MPPDYSAYEIQDYIEDLLDRRAKLNFLLSWQDLYDDKAPKAIKYPSFNLGFLNIGFEIDHIDNAIKMLSMELTEYTKPIAINMAKDHIDPNSRIYQSIDTKAKNILAHESYFLPRLARAEIYDIYTEYNNIYHSHKSKKTHKSTLSSEISALMLHHMHILTEQYNSYEEYLNNPKKQPPLTQFQIGDVIVKFQESKNYMETEIIKFKQKEINKLQQNIINCQTELKTLSENLRLLEEQINQKINQNVASKNLQATINEFKKLSQKEYEIKYMLKVSLEGLDSLKEDKYLLEINLENTILDFNKKTKDYSTMIKTLTNDVKKAKLGLINQDFKTTKVKIPTPINTELVTEKDYDDSFTHTPIILAPSPNVQSKSIENDNTIVLLQTEKLIDSILNKHKEYREKAGNDVIFKPNKERLNKINEVEKKIQKIIYDNKNPDPKQKLVLIVGLIVLNKESMQIQEKHKSGIKKMFKKGSRLASIYDDIIKSAQTNYKIDPYKSALEFQKQYHLQIHLLIVFLWRELRRII
ncbi:MAG: hypothetical protein HRT87_08905 [Legionellales bacterium]|nr:hypothetical protein [Legionellales bacterium]